MKIEKISDNQIKCTLNKSDLASRQIKISELAYGTEKAKNLFRDMMQQASLEFGFEAEDIPLMIEAIPVSTDCIVLVITKVEDPEELDTRFSRFAPSDEDLEDMEDIDEDMEGSIADDFIDMFNQSKSVPSPVSGDTFVPLQESLAVKNNDKKPASPKPLFKIYSFGNLNAVMDVSRLLSGIYKGQNSLFKSPFNSRYYLIVYKSSHSLEEFSSICCVISEYSSDENSSVANEAYVKEHFIKIIPRKALQKLQIVNHRRNK